jgi:hypothetical protein
MATDLSKATDEDAAPLVERRLGLTLENTGGGTMCFVFYGSQNDKKTDLYFGWANGGLGYCLMAEDGAIAVESGELPQGSDADAQSDFITTTCARLGFKIVPEPTDEENDKARDDYFDATKAKRERIVEEAQEAFWAVIAKKYPKAESGDFMPDASMDFDSACEKAVEHWLAMNLPLDVMKKEVA